MCCNDEVEDSEGKVKKCGWKGEKRAIETFDKDEREKIETGLLEEIGECSSCGSKNLKTEVKEGRLDYKAAKRGVCPNFIHSLDACHMRTAINQFRTKVEEFGFFAVHDSFGTHACDVEEMRDTVVRTCLLYTSPSPRDKRQSRMPSSA